LATVAIPGLLGGAHFLARGALQQQADFPGVDRERQEQAGFLEQLLDPLAGHAEGGGDGVLELGMGAVQTVVGTQDVGSPRSEVGYPALNCRDQEAPLDLVQGISRRRRGERWRGLPEAPTAPRFELDVTADGDDGVGREGGVPAGIEAQQGFPEANAASLEGLVIGEDAGGKAVQDPVDEGFVLPDEVIQAVGAALLGVVELIGVEGGRMMQLR
jgi:hypothetical protein